MLGRQLPRWFSKQTIVVYVLNATRKTIAGNFWRLTNINQWVVVKFKILSCMFTWFYLPEFLKFDRTFLTVVKFVTVWSFKCSIIFNSFMFLVYNFKILSSYYFYKIKLLEVLEWKVIMAANYTEKSPICVFFLHSSNYKHPPVHKFCFDIFSLWFCKQIFCWYSVFFFAKFTIKCRKIAFAGAAKICSWSI